MNMTTLKSRRARLLCSTGLAVAGALLVSSAASAQEQVETVVITGSRLAVTSAFDAPTPVTVVGAEDIKMSGAVNIESLLNQTPQFVGATNGGPTSNTQQPNGQSGGAYVNLRGLNSGGTTVTSRSLVLVNGRRYTIGGTYLMTDLNTIPMALVERTEVVTGGSSAVYGSDAIAGVVNFVMKQNFTGAQVDAHMSIDAATSTPVYSFDLTVGGNFDHDRGNVAVSLDYLNRGGITQSQVDYAKVPLNESCVTASSWSSRFPGTALPGGTAANCVANGGKMGFTQGGSTSTPAGQFLPVYTGNDPTLTTPNTGLYALAGIGGIGSTGFTFNGSTPRLTNNPTDYYNTTALNNMQLPQERWMMNTFAHYDLTSKITAYAEMHFSNNTVQIQLTPSNLGSQSMLFNVNNPYLSPAMDAVLNRLDQLETGTTSITEGSKTYTTTPGDGLAILKINRRFVELGNRVDSDNRVAWRFAGGFKGELGDVSTDFFKDLTFDVYYDYARTTDTSFLSGVGSRSAIQNAVLSQNGLAPVCDIFGSNMSAACIAAVSISDSYTTKAEQAGAQATIAGTVFDAPAGPVQFDLGGEWRFDQAQYIPDPYMASGEPTGFNGSLPTKGSESVNEVFGELRVPVISDVPLIEKFTINSAFRYSDYNLAAVGGVWTYSAGADWKVIDDISFRGQFQHAIRAPNVGELFGGTQLNYTTPLTDPCGSLTPVAQQTAALRAICVATGVPAANVFSTLVQDASARVGYISGGNPNLHQEASDTITFGTVLTPRFIPGLTASIDFWSIDVKGAIAGFGGSAAQVLSGCYGQSSASNPYCQVITRDSTGAIDAPNYILLGEANLGFMKVQGIDFGGAYSFDVDWGLLTGSSNFSTTSNWTWSLENRANSGTPGAYPTNCAGAFGATCGEPSPRLKGMSRVTWADGPLSLSLAWRFVASVTDDRYLVFLRNGAPGITPLAQMTNPVIPDYHYFDLSATYGINENLDVTAGVNNVFGTNPPVVIKSAGYGNTWPSTYDAFGQTFFINLTARTN